MQAFLTNIAQRPALWATLRRIVENNYVGERAAIADELTPWLQTKPRRFLDFGCGTGEFASSFPQHSYMGVDLSQGYVRYAATLTDHRFGVMNGNALAFGDASFDAALIVGVIHHLNDELAQITARELHRVLAPGGEILMLEDIPAQDWWNVPGRLMHWLDRGDAIRQDEDYGRLFAPYFTIQRRWSIRSGICDYAVYRFSRVD